MKATRLLTPILLLGMFLPGAKLSAQSADDQLLIFRNTGVTDLLYQSEIDSITFTRTDMLGVEYDAPVAQVFHTADTALYVPIAEIDSVCLGSRNEIEFQPDVRILADDPDMQWIIRFDGSNIYYKATTPDDILPKVNQKLFYSEMTEMFPCGLCAVVEEVTRGGNEIVVSISCIELSDIFRKFFYAGSIDGMEEEMQKAQARRVEEIDKGETLKFTLDIGDFGEFGVDGRIEMHQNIVLDVLKKYYHADITLTTVFGSSLKVKSDDSASYEDEITLLSIPLPTVALVFHPSIEIFLFVDIEAELALEFDFDRKVTTTFEWTRKGDEQTFTRSTPAEDGDQKNQNQAKAQITLDGSIFAGIGAQLNFNLVGDIAGAQAKLKLGPEFSSEVSIELLQDLSEEYDVDAYGKAELDMEWLLKFEGVVEHKKYWIVGDIEKEVVLEYEHPFAESSIDLFPRYVEPRATLSPSKEEVSVAVKSDNEIAYEVETGFQVMNPEDVTAPIDSVFVGEIEVKPEDVVQGVDTLISIPKSVAEADSVVLRPVFHYAGFTIPHATFNALQDPNIQPVIFCFNDKSALMVSGIPVVDNVTIDSTMYVIGPFVPIATYDTVFHKVSPYAETKQPAKYITPKDAEDLVGQWHGELEGEDVFMEFTEEDSCSYSCSDLSFDNVLYELNKPQSGCILMGLENDPLVIEVLFVSDTSLEIRFKNHSHRGMKCVLSRN